jgi:hypothetical protein
MMERQDQSKASFERSERAVWERPALRRLRAGAAEDGFGAVADGGQPS